MKKAISTLLALVTLGNTYSDWVTVYKTGVQPIGYSHAKCYYSNHTIKRVSIVIQGGPYSCPYSIEYNLVTNEWR
jgi:hypothetical protein